MVESNVSRLRSLNFTEVLEPYLKSPEKLVQLNALASLAGFIDEKESEMLNSNQDSVKFLMKVLKNSLGSSTRRYQGWSSKESASGEFWIMNTIFLWLEGGVFFSLKTDQKPAIAAMHGPHSLVRFGD